MKIVVREIQKTAGQVLYLHKASVEVVQDLDGKNLYKVNFQNIYVNNLQLCAENVLKILFNCGCVLYLTEKEILKAVLCRKHAKELQLNKKLSEISKKLVSVEK